MSNSTLNVPVANKPPNGNTISSPLALLMFNELGALTACMFETAASSAPPPVGDDHVPQSFETCAIKSPLL